jgi:hypothetical protein
MNRTSIPNAVRPIRLAEFLPEFGEDVIWVWANPTQELLVRRTEQIRRAISVREQLIALKPLTDEDSQARVIALGKEMEQVGEAMMAWLAEIWSQHEDPETHFSLEDVKALANESMEREPALYGWLIDQTMRLIAEHRKKK